MEFDNPVVSREAWTQARAEVLAKEKALTRQRDALTAEIRSMPWVKVDKDYRFDTRAGERTLVDLFEGKRQLFVYHFMLGPGWKAGCPSCSFWADHFAAFGKHLPQRDVKFTAISRAPLSEIERYRERLGWRFDWASSHSSDFNVDYGVSDGEEDESPGISVFARRGADVFHTYFTTGRGLEAINNTYAVLDLVPRGRDEGALKWPMAWVKRHDEYEQEST